MPPGGQAGRFDAIHRRSPRDASRALGRARATCSPECRRMKCRGVRKRKSFACGTRSAKERNCSPSGCLIGTVMTSSAQSCQGTSPKKNIEAQQSKRIFLFDEMHVSGRLLGIVGRAVLIRTSEKALLASAGRGQLPQNCTVAPRSRQCSCNRCDSQKNANSREPLDRVECVRPLR